MKTRRLWTGFAAVFAGLAVGAQAGATPPANPNASCVGQSVSSFVPFSADPFGALVSVSARTTEPNVGLVFVAPEARAPHDACPE